MVGALFVVGGGDAAPYDADYYERQLVRAAESVVSPLGWDRNDVRRHLREARDAGLWQGTDAAERAREAREETKRGVGTR